MVAAGAAEAGAIQVMRRGGADMERAGAMGVVDTEVQDTAADTAAGAADTAAGAADTGIAGSGSSAAGTASLG
jgi:hypothetical protein